MVKNKNTQDSRESINLMIEGAISKHFKVFKMEIKKEVSKLLKENHIDFKKVIIDFKNSFKKDIENLKESVKNNKVQNIKINSEIKKLDKKYEDMIKDKLENIKMKEGILDFENSTYDDGNNTQKRIFEIRNKLKELEKFS